MSIITISRGSYSRGKEVAEALAERLNYECVSRDILLETCEEFHIPEMHLVKALHDAPSILDRFNHGKERYLSYFRSSFLNHMVKDNIVYHGLAGHFFLRNIQHALKARIIANMEDRVREEMKRENIDSDEARYRLKKDDDERRKWSLYVHGKDTQNCSLYDIILHIDILTVDDVVDNLESIIRKERFATTEKSMTVLKHMALMANIHAKVVNLAPKAIVTVDGNAATLSRLDGVLSHDTKKRAEVKQSLIDRFGLEDVIFQDAVKAQKDHINTFYNIDYKESPPGEKNSLL